MLLMLILYIYLNLFIRMRFAFKSFQNLITLVTLRRLKVVSKPSQISLSSIIIEPCHQLVNPHVHPTDFQTRIRMNMFKPLRLPYHLHPYPLDFLEYLPHFSGEDHVSAEKHLGAFVNFVDNLEISS
jgi:hypothetical protein